MIASIIAAIFKLLGVVETFLSRRFSSENVAMEKSKRESEIQDEAELAAKLAKDPNTKDEGINKMRDLISD